MDSPCIKQTVCKVLNRFQHVKYLDVYVLTGGFRAYEKGSQFSCAGICTLYTLSACACNNKPLKSLLMKNVIQGSAPLEGPGAKTYFPEIGHVAYKSKGTTCDTG